MFSMKEFFQTLTKLNRSNRRIFLIIIAVVLLIVYFSGEIYLHTFKWLPKEAPSSAIVEITKKQQANTQTDVAYEITPSIEFEDITTQGETFIRQVKFIDSSVIALRAPSTFKKPFDIEIGKEYKIWYRYPYSSKGVDYLAIYDIKEKDALISNYQERYLSPFYYTTQLGHLVYDPLLIMFWPLNFLARYGWLLWISLIPTILFCYRYRKDKVTVLLILFLWLEVSAILSTYFFSRIYLGD